MKTLEQQLTRLDLNLLVALSVLLNERSVTNAAHLLYVPQPAMSQTLSRLRILFDDPLFHRDPSGLVPTSKALEIEAPLHRLLTDLHQLICAKPFLPEQCEQAFRISFPPLVGELMAALIGEHC